MTRRGARNALSRRALMALAGGLAWTPAIRAAELGWRDVRKSMWVWKDRLEQPGDLVSFCGAQKIDTLFLYVSPKSADALLAARGEAAEVLRELRAGGRRVYALCGDPDWITQNGSHLPAQLASLVRIKNELGLFDGLALDVEPQALPGWHDIEERAALAAGTLSFFDRVRRTVPDAMIDAAVNVIFGEMRLTGGANFLLALAERVNSVSIMAYRNRVPAALTFASPAIRAVQQAARPWRMGVLVDPDNEPGISWSKVPQAQFIDAMVRLDRILAARFRDHYTGLAFEGFDGLRVML